MQNTTMLKEIKKNIMAILTGNPRNIAFVFSALKFKCSSSIRIKDYFRTVVKMKSDPVLIVDCDPIIAS